MGDEVHSSHHHDHFELHDQLKHIVHKHVDHIYDDEQCATIVNELVQYVHEHYLERPRYHEHLDDHKPTDYIDHNHNGRALHHEHYGTHSVEYNYLYGDTVLRSYPNDNDDHSPDCD